MIYYMYNKQDEKTMNKISMRLSLSSFYVGELSG